MSQSHNSCDQLDKNRWMQQHWSARKLCIADQFAGPQCVCQNYRGSLPQLELSISILVSMCRWSSESCTSKLETYSNEFAERNIFCDLKLEQERWQIWESKPYVPPYLFTLDGGRVKIAKIKGDVKKVTHCERWVVEEMDEDDEPKHLQKTIQKPEKRAGLPLCYWCNMSK